MCAAFVNNRVGRREVEEEDEGSVPVKSSVPKVECTEVFQWLRFHQMAVQRRKIVAVDYSVVGGSIVHLISFSF